MNNPLKMDNVNDVDFFVVAKQHKFISTGKDPKKPTLELVETFAEATHFVNIIEAIGIAGQPQVTGRVEAVFKAGVRFRPTVFTVEHP